MITDIIIIVCFIVSLIVNIGISLYQYAYEKGWREHQEFIDSFFDTKINDEKLKVIIGDAENENEEQRN